MSHALHAIGLFLAGWALIFIIIGRGFFTAMGRHKGRTAAVLGLAIAAAAAHESTKRPGQVPQPEPLDLGSDGSASEEES